MDVDLSIALLQKEKWIREQEEIRQQERDKYDPRKWMTYTLEGLIEGIRSGKQLLYSLLMEFEPKEVFDGKLKLPYIKNFFILEKEEPETVIWGSERPKMSLMISCIPCQGAKQSQKEWVDQSVAKLRELKLRARLLQTQKTGRMEYFCYEVPSAEGVVYNISFRYQKEEYLYAGNLNCMNKDKEGMGLLMEALLYVTEEMNQ